MSPVRSTAPRRVVVVGSINHDLVVRAPRHPRPGETVTGTGLRSGMGGKGLNQAVAAARAGAQVALVAAVGDDEAGAQARTFLDQEGIDVSMLMISSSSQTGHAVVTVDDAGENSIVVLPGANAVLGVDQVRRGLAGLHRDDVVVLQHELVGATTVAAATLAASAGATVVWNAAPAPEHLDDVPLDVDVVVVNEHELHVVAGLLNLEADADRADQDGGDPRRLLLARAVGERLGAVVVCTLGGEGSLVVDAGRHESVAAASVDVVDTTAAGDTFIGYLVSTLGTGPVTAAELTVAGAAAGVTVGRAGAATSIPRRAEVDEALRRTSGTGSPTRHAVPTT